MTSPSVSVCFPAYEEKLTIRDVLKEAHELLSASDIDYEILVCNDGSSDATGRVIDEIARTTPRMRVIHHERNRGIRYTFEHLYAEAANEFVFLNSTDGQWDTGVLFDLLPLTDRADIVIATRREKHYTPARRFISWGFNMLPRPRSPTNLPSRTCTLPRTVTTDGRPSIAIPSKPL